MPTAAPRLSLSGHAHDSVQGQYALRIQARRIQARRTTLRGDGGAQGIGFAIANSLRDAGARLVIADLDVECGRAAADKVGGMFVQMDVRMDVTNSASVDDAFNKIVVQYGMLDVLVNNAGIVPSTWRSTPMTMHGVPSWRSIWTACSIVAAAPRDS
jgi:hypothetical protein